MKTKHYASVLTLCLFLSSCADEDLAMLGAVAAGAASNYAGANGDSATAASLLETQQQIMNEASNTAAANTANAASVVQYVTASPVAGKPGFAISPHSGKAVDVKGIAAGSLVEDPTTPNARFRVPESAVTSASAATPSSSGHGITGTWKNSKLTWVLDTGGEGRLIVPSTNGNGVATTYMTYRTDPGAGTFTYTLTRSTLTGTLNCTGDSDMEITTTKTYTEKYSLSGKTLTIGSEVMSRD